MTQPATFRVGQRVRYVGLTVAEVASGTYGTVTDGPSGRGMAEVRWDSTLEGWYWPAELEAVVPDPCAQCEHGKASHRLFEVERDPEPWSWCKECGGLCEFVPPGGVLGGETVAS